MLSAITGCPGMNPRSRTILKPRRTQLSYKELKPGLLLLSAESVTQKFQAAGARVPSVALTLVYSGGGDCPVK